MAEKNYITPDGYKRLVDELTELAVVERPRVVREVSDAAAEGDRSENAAYIYGKRRLREIDRRLGFLKRRLEYVQVVKADESRTDRVFFGAWVEIEDEEGERHVYQIVGVDEVEVEKGHISWKSPIGHALLGKAIDDSFVVKWHAGQRELTIVDIRYRQHADGDTQEAAGESAPLDAETAARRAKNRASELEATPADPNDPNDGDDSDDEPFESDEEAERIALNRARQTAKKKQPKPKPIKKAALQRPMKMAAAATATTNAPVATRAPVKAAPVAVKGPSKATPAVRAPANAADAAKTKVQAKSGPAASVSRAAQIRAAVTGQGKPAKKS